MGRHRRCSPLNGNVTLHNYRLSEQIRVIAADIYVVTLKLLPNVDIVFQVSHATLMVVMSVVSLVDGLY